MDEIFLHVHPSAIENNQFYLSKDESHHFLKSLRGSVGDEVWLLDGKGFAYQARVKKIDNLIVRGSINDSFANFGENKKSIHLVLGLIKGKRMDLAIEKSVEFGVKSIHPVLFERSIKKTLNFGRLSKVITSSAKQTGRSIFPELKKILRFPDWIKKYENNDAFACHFSGKSKIKNIVNLKTDDIMIIVGPEGDFSASEIALLNASKVPLVNLGPRRLRTESACISSILTTSDVIEG
tara:strand:+ start:192 stop:902 length:711 start_codon:yes stop_codon:yes gene_type:complete